MRQSTDRRAARPVRPAAAAVSKMVSRAWSLPPQRTFVAVERAVQVPMSDGTVLLADHYLPITSRPAATVLVRCPYGRGGPFGLLNAQLIAERGFHVLLQSCRGTFGSGGQFEPMRGEISDGQDTMAWLRGQSWFDGRLATFGASYLGFVQWALAMDPPPELAAAVVFVGPHDFSRTAYRLRLQVAGGAHPRFARNPGNGQVDVPAQDFVATRYSIGLSAENPSALVVSQTDRKAAAHA